MGMQCNAEWWNVTQWRYKTESALQCRDLKHAIHRRNVQLTAHRSEKECRSMQFRTVQWQRVVAAGLVHCSLLSLHTWPEVRRGGGVRGEGWTLEREHYNTRWCPPTPPCSVNTLYGANLPRSSWRETAFFRNEQPGCWVRPLPVGNLAWARKVLWSKYIAIKFWLNSQTHVPISNVYGLSSCWPYSHEYTYTHTHTHT